MKMVTAIIRPLRLDDVVNALEAMGLDRLVVSEVRGVGRTPPSRRSLPDLPQTLRLPSRTKIEIAVANEQVRSVIDAICTAGAIGLAGDGKIFVSDLECAVRIRNGERGERAL